MKELKAAAAKLDEDRTVLMGEMTEDLTKIKLYEVQIGEIHAWMESFGDNLGIIPELRKMMISIAESLVGMANSQSLVAKSVEASVKQNEEMKDVFKRLVSVEEKAENRHETLQTKFIELAEQKGGKDQVPMKTHLWTVVAALLVSVIVCLAGMMCLSWVLGLDIKTKLVEITNNQKDTRELITKSTEKIIVEDKK